MEYSGLGSAAARLTVIGRGEGNFNGSRAHLSLDLLPGLDASPDRVVLQQFPGFAFRRRELQYTPGPRSFIKPPAPPDKLALLYCCRPSTAEQLARFMEHPYNPHLG